MSEIVVESTPLVVNLTVVTSPVNVSLTAVSNDIAYPVTVSEGSTEVGLTITYPSVGGTPGPQGPPGVPGGASPYTSPVFTYTENALSRIDYTDGSFRLFFYVDGALDHQDLQIFGESYVIRKTFIYSNGVLASINETII
jgi:hypothetical protein